MVTTHPVNAFEGMWMQPLVDRGEDIQTGVFASPQGIHFTVKISDAQASNLSPVQARVISKAYVEFVKTILDPITANTGKETPVFGMLISSENMTAQYREVFHQYLANLQKGVVDPDLQIDSEGTLTLQVYCNGKPDSIDPILKQVEILTADIFNSVSAFEVSVRGVFQQPSDAYINTLSERVLEPIFLSCKKAKIPFRGVVTTPKGEKIVNEKQEDPDLIQWELQDTMLTEDFSEKILHELPVLTSDPFLKSFKKALERIGSSFQFLSVVQLLEFFIFRVLEKEIREGEGFSSLEDHSGSPLKVGGLPLKTYAAKSTTLADSLRIFGKFLYLWKRGGILGGTLGHSLNLLHQFLNDPLHAQEMQGQVLDEIPLSCIKQMQTYFTNCLKRCKHSVGYRLSPESLNDFNQPIFRLIKSQTIPKTQLSCLITQWAFVFEKLLNVSSVIAVAQKALFLEKVQPLLEIFIQEAAAKLAWSPQKVDKVKAIIHHANSEFLCTHDLFGKRERCLRKQIILPALRLIPLDKIARFYRQKSEEDVYLWLERNWKSVHDLREYLQLNLGLSEDYNRSLRWSVKNFPYLIAYCLKTEMDAAEITEEKLIQGFQKFIAQLDSSIKTPEIALPQLGLAQSIETLVTNFQGIVEGSLACLYLSQSGKSLLERLFELIDNGRKQYQLTADLLKQEESAKASRFKQKSTHGKQHPQRTKGKSSGSRSFESQVKAKAISEPEAPLPISLQPMVSEDPLTAIYDTISHAMDCNSSSLTNLYARQCWLNAIEIYKDLFSEFVDLPNFQQSTHVSNYVNRLVVLLSLFAEQIVSTYALENRKPTDLIDRHETVHHNCLKMLSTSGLENRIPHIQERLESVNGLEMLSRNLLIHRHNPSRGACLLYAAEDLIIESPLSSSNASDHIERAASIVSATHDLFRDQLELLGEILGVPLDLTAIRKLMVCPENSSKQTGETSDILKKIDTIQKRFDLLLKKKISSSSQQLGPHEYLRDASRLLRLIQARIERRSEDGNVRNFFKELATLTALSLEFCVITLAGWTGKFDLSNFKWSRSSHNLTNWFEKLEFYNLDREEEVFLEFCDQIHNLSRYSANYERMQERDSSQSFYLQLLKRMKHSEVIYPPGDGEAAWQSADRKLRNSVKIAIADSYKRLKLGLGLLSKVLQQLEQLRH